MATPDTIPVPQVARSTRHVSGDAWPCYLCNRPIREPLAAISLEVVDGGVRIARPGTADVTDPGYMGFFPVGPECARRIPAEFRAPAGA